MKYVRSDKWSGSPISSHRYHRNAGDLPKPFQGKRKRAFMRRNEREWRKVIKSYHLALGRHNNCLIDAHNESLYR